MDRFAHATKRLRMLPMKLLVLLKIVLHERGGHCPIEIQGPPFQRAVNFESRALSSALRPKPDEPKRTYEGSNLTAEQIYWRTWRLDILWLITFYGLVLQNVSVEIVQVGAPFAS